MLHTAEHEAEHTCLDFSGAPSGRRGGYSWGGGFGVGSSTPDIFVNLFLTLIFRRFGVSDSQQMGRKWLPGVVVDVL